jgi:nucleoid DNA-binding protein
MPRMERSRRGLGQEMFRQVPDRVFELLLKEGRINFPGGYGSLYMATIPARRQKGRNGEMVLLRQKKDVRFSAGGKLNERLTLMGL